VWLGGRVNYTERSELLLASETVDLSRKRRPWIVGRRRRSGREVRLGSDDWVMR
jgi:hypothetical protein